MKDVEAELDQLGYKYTVHPGKGITGTVYFVLKGQKNPHQESQELHELAERNGGKLDDSGKSRAYRIYITSLEHNK